MSPQSRPELGAMVVGDQYRAARSETLATTLSDRVTLSEPVKPLIPEPALVAGLQLRLKRRDRRLKQMVRRQSRGPTIGSRG